MTNDMETHLKGSFNFIMLKNKDVVDYILTSTQISHAILQYTFKIPMSLFNLVRQKNTSNILYNSLGTHFFSQKY